MNTLTPDLLYATIAAALTGLLWIPIILNRIAEMGVWKALKNPQPDVRPEAEWAYRLANAHRNAIENLVVFAPLAIIVHVMALGDGLTALAGIVYVAVRLAHAVIYTFGIPLLRTTAFLIGFGSQVTLALRIFGIL